MHKLVGLLFLAALTVRAETYDAWERGVAGTTGGVSVVYLPWMGFASTHDWCEKVHNGYEGDLLLQATPADLQHLPLHVRIWYADVKENEIVKSVGNKNARDGIWLQTGGACSNRTALSATNWNASAFATNNTTTDRVKPGTTICETLAETETILPALESGMARVGFGFPRNRQSFTFRRQELAGIAARYEVTDATGRVLARGIVPEFVGSSDYRQLASEAWVMGDVEADRLLRERCGLGGVETVMALPDAAAAYESLRAIWVSQSAWNTMTDSRFWQRRLLQGVSLYGRPETVRAMQAVLDPGSNGVLLAAQLAALTATGEHAANTRSSSYGCQNMGLDLKYENTDAFEKSALDNVRPLFEDAVRYRVWTIVVLGIFTVGTVVLLVLAFLRLPGPRRMTLWWALPLWAGFFALLGGGVGRLVLARAARADVTEYRYAHLNWPEMYCQAVGRMLRFDGGECAWRLPANAVESPSAPEVQKSSSDSPRQAVRHDVYSPDGVSMTDVGVSPGTSDSMKAAWFRPCALPFEVVATEKGRRLRATADLTGVYVWAGKHWHNMGDLKSGTEADPLAQKNPQLNRVPGLPQALAGIWSKDSNASGRSCCSNRNEGCEIQPAPNGPVPAASGTWLVVAVQRSEPGMRPVDAKAKTTGRVVWIVQCP